MKFYHFKNQSIMKKVIILAVIAIFMLQSCRTSGYGCKGRATWEQVVRKANRPF